MSDFKKSQEAAFRKCVRDAIRQSYSFTKSQRDVVLYIANLWLHHRNGREGVIRPGRERIAKKANVSVRTVASVMADMRDAGVLIPVAYPKGGRRATQYKMRISKIFEYCGHEMPEWMRGELIEVTVQKLGEKPCKVLKFDQKETVQKLHTDIYNATPCSGDRRGSAPL